MNTIITSVLLLLPLSIPLFFTTLNFELFEFPKFILLLSATIILVVATFFDRPNFRDFWPTHKYARLTSLAVLGVLATQLVSTLFSIDPHTSFWGYYSRFHQGLLTTTCYTLIYFIGQHYLHSKSTQKLLFISLLTSFFISLYAILQRLGIDQKLWIQDVVNRPFSTLGQPNWLAAYLLPHLFLALYHTASASSAKRLRYLLIYAVIFVAFLFTKSRSGLIAFFLSFTAYWLLMWRNLSWVKIKSLFTTASIITFLTLLLVGTPYTPSLSSLIQQELTSRIPAVTSGTQLESGGTESGEIRKIVWTGAVQLFLAKPLLGTGPETFAYSYYWTRPTSHNYTSEWDFLYNKAHNEYLNYAATTGSLGLLSFLGWHLIIGLTSLSRPPTTKKTKKQKENNHLLYTPVLGATLISFTVTNFFGFSVIPVYLIFLLLSIATFTLAKEPVEKSTHLTNIPAFWLITLILLVFFPLRLFAADLSFNKGKAHLEAGNFEQAESLLYSAISYRPNEPLYHSYLAETYAQLSVQNPNDQSRQLALNEITFVQTHNPWHLNYLKTNTKAYLALAQLDPSYYQNAAAELETARKLAPTDPKLAYNLGLVYSRLNQLDDSIKQMQESIALKTNYYEPYYALTLLYEEAKNTQEIPALLEQAKASLTVIPAPLQTKLDTYLPE